MLIILDQDMSKSKAIWYKIKTELLNKETFMFTIIGELIFWSPVIVTFILSLFEPYYYTVLTAIIIFWTAPLTPAIPLQIALIIGLKKLYKKIKKEERN